MQQKLLAKDVAWHWQSEEEKAFTTLKQLLKTPPVLSNYKVEKPVALQVDACSVPAGEETSSYGIEGAR